MNSGGEAMVASPPYLLPHCLALFLPIMGGKE